jgi:hypothetical protein
MAKRILNAVQQKKLKGIQVWANGSHARKTAFCLCLFPVVDKNYIRQFGMTKKTKNLFGFSCVQMLLIGFK